MTMTVSEMKELNNECCQRNCDLQATNYVFWPGQGKKRMCNDHSHQARIVAGAMGFTLHIEEIPDAEKQSDRPRVRTA